MSDYKYQYNLWLQNITDEQMRAELASMGEQEIEEAFSGKLSFGTAGLRGVMTLGTNRMNVYTVYRATEGLARYMDAHKMTKCAITYDSRNNSRLFSEISAATLASHGIKVYITKECMPTPYLSYMVRELGCDIGVNVTASHNPSKYNGYKVYDSNGCQLLDDDANEVTSFIEKVQLFEHPLPKFDSYIGGLIEFSNSELEDKYINRVLEERLSNEPLDNLSVVYTPLNGAGYRVVPETLRRAGLTNMTVVEQQSYPDGNFPTCSYPNPEKNEALALAIELAKQQKADVVIANDPDCDRLGVAVLCDGDVRQLSGNEVGIVLTDYILSCLGQDAKSKVVVKTIVTSLMIDTLVANYGAEVRDVLTGFKYIGDVIGQLESVGQVDRYAFGFEESCGYLKGSYVRDKDGVVASLLIAECAEHYKKLGLTLVDRLNQLAEKFGHYYQNTISYSFEGIEGAKIKEQLLSELRCNSLQALGNSQVVDVCDFLTQTKYSLPKADVLRFRSSDGSQLIVRPSGTEPLIKCYITVRGDQQSNSERYAAIKAQTDNFFNKK